MRVSYVSRGAGLPYGMCIPFTVLPLKNYPRVFYVPKIVPTIVNLASVILLYYYIIVTWAILGT